MSAQPADGTAIILHLIEAARELRSYDNWPGHVGTSNIVYWIEKLEERYARDRIEPAPVGWEPRAWRDLLAGDTISLGGVEAVVEKAHLHRWHVSETEYTYHPGPDRGEESDGCRGCGGRCRETRGRKYAEHERAYVGIKLVGREKVYQMPLEGEVETLRGQGGQALDEVNGFRSSLAEEPIDVMASWAADAALTLEHAGLGPIEVMRVEGS